MAALSYGRIDEFQPENDSIAAYLERVELYFSANGIVEEKQVPVFLSVIGGRTYSLLRNLLAPDKPSGKDLNCLTTTLKRHFEPKRVVVAERFHFHRRSQAVGENIAEYVAELRRLSTHCEFGTYLEQALRDRLVCGLRNEAIQRRLLTKSELTFGEALQIAQGMEAADTNAQQLKGADPAVQFVSSRMTTQLPPKPAVTCYRCGRSGHLAGECRLKDVICHNCGKRGHIAKVCRSKEGSRKTKPLTGNYRPQQAKWVQLQQTDDDGAEESDTDLPVLKVGSEARSAHPITVELGVNGKTLTMELDTGAAVSIISEQTQRKTFPDTPLRRSTAILRTYTGESMTVAGELEVQVNYGSQSHKLPLLVVAGKGPSLFGRDWLQHIQLNWKTIGLATLDRGQGQVQMLLQQYPEVFAEELGTMKQFKATLQVKKDSRPIFCKPRSVPFALKDAISKELDRLESEGILQKVSHSDWAAPIVPVPKGDGSIRICGDYKVTINPYLDIDKYPLPNPNVLFASLAGGQRFTKLDLSQAYTQMPLHEDSQQFATINTHQGLYRYKRLPFGIASAPAIFQRTMDTILQGLPNVVCYIDDILITGATEKEHLQNLEEVLKRLQREGITVKKSKCFFLQACVEYLGHCIDGDGLHTSDKKVKAVQQAPRPTNPQQLRSFLGLVQYYRKFVPSLATLLSPLYSLLQKDVKWCWTKECERAFKEAKETLSSATVLAHYDPRLPLRLAADASSYGVGAVISHVFPDGSERPIAYASRSLTTTEKSYAQLEKEALSLVFGVRKFHQYLYGRKFTLYTDHKPLTTILGPKKGVPPLAAARLQRWALLLSAYSYQIEYKSTKDHANADGLSRLPLSSPDTTSMSTIVSPPQHGSLPDTDIFVIRQIEALPVTAMQLRAATRCDPILSRVLRYAKHGWPHQVSDVFKPYHTRQNELALENGCVMWGVRVIVPKKLQEQVLHELHRSHPGIARMKTLARSHVWWPKLDQDIESLVKACPQCQSVRSSPSVAPLHPWSWPSRPWQRIHVDYAGPFRGRNFLIVVDAHSKWPEVIQMNSTTSSATIHELRRLFATYGLPEQLVSDNGPQFVSDEFKGFLKANHVKHIRSAPYHPSSNGAAERFVRTFKQALRTGNHPELTFHQQLMTFLLSYRSTPHATTQVTPASLFLKRDLRTRLDLLHPDLGQTVAASQAQQKQHHDQHAHPRNLFVGQRVLVRNFRPGPTWLPGTVVNCNGPLSYQVKVSGDRIWNRHIDHLLEAVDSPRASSTVDIPDSPSRVSIQPTSTELVTDPGEENRSESESVEVTECPAVPPVSSPGPVSAQTPPRRYPQRTRRPPDFFQVSYSREGGM